MKQPKVLLIACDAIEPPALQLRASINPDDLQALADSIRARGLLSPILVRKRGDRYTIVAGHRRFLACRSLGHMTIAAIVTTGAAHGDAADSLHENLYRSPLTPIEEAALVAHLRDSEKMDTETIARALSHSTAWVESRAALLELHPKLQRALHDGTVSLAAARALARLTHDAYIDNVIDAARSHGLSERHALQWAAQYDLYVQALDAGRPTTIPTPELIHAEASQVPCDFCGHLAYIGTTKLLRVCYDCLKAMQQVRDQEARPTPRTAPPY